MSVLVTGAAGQLGRELTKAAPAAGVQLIACGRSELDITDRDAVASMLARQKPVLVVNGAAYTTVDRAEEEPDRAFAVNRDGARNLAAACGVHGIPLLHVSTDYVFPGDGQGAYSEEDAAAAPNVYGQSKWEGEEQVRSLCPRHIILRTSWVFGAHGRNFVRSMVRLGQVRTELRVVADQSGCPTWAGHIAAVLLHLAARIEQREGLPWGTYHYCGAPPTTWYHFAQAIFDAASRLTGQAPPEITAIRTADYPTAARRPANSVLDCRKIQEAFGLDPEPWAEGLELTLQEWLETGEYPAAGQSAPGAHG